MKEHLRHMIKETITNQTIPGALGCFGKISCHVMSCHVLPRHESFCRSQSFFHMHCLKTCSHACTGQARDTGVCSGGPGCVSRARYSSSGGQAGCHRSIQSVFRSVQDSSVQAGVRLECVGGLAGGRRAGELAGRPWGRRWRGGVVAGGRKGGAQLALSLPSEEVDSEVKATLKPHTAITYLEACNLRRASLQTGSSCRRCRSLRLLALIIRFYDCHCHPEAYKSRGTLHLKASCTFWSWAARDNQSFPLGTRSQ